MAKGRKTGGRVKGTPNKATREMKEWARELFESEEWRASAHERIVSGKAPHLEAHVLQVLMPKTEKHEHGGLDGEPLITRVVHTYTDALPDAR